MNTTMNRRAQAAMEFLMTYGWAILVVLAAIGALAYFGVLNPGKFVPQKCYISGGVSCVEFAMLSGTPGVSNGGIAFRAQNSLGEPVTIESVRIKFKGTPVVGLPACAGYKNASTTGFPITLQPGESAFFGNSAALNALGLTNYVLISDPAPGSCMLGGVGSHVLRGRVSADIAILYRTASGQISHTIDGEISGSI